jgi:hypothetical protein
MQGLSNVLPSRKSITKGERVCTHTEHYPWRRGLPEKRRLRQFPVVCKQPNLNLSASIHPVSLITNPDSELQSTTTFLEFRFYSYNVVSFNIHVCLLFYVRATFLAHLILIRTCSLDFYLK